MFQVTQKEKKKVTTQPNPLLTYPNLCFSAQVPYKLPLYDTPPAFETMTIPIKYLHSKPPYLGKKANQSHLFPFFSCKIESFQLISFFDKIQTDLSSNINHKRNSYLAGKGSQAKLKDNHAQY